MSNQDGLEWVEGKFGLEPHWIREPDTNIVSQIARKNLNLSSDVPVDVTFHSKGAFTKLYKISTPDKPYLLRVSLPVDPHHRTESAVSTIAFVRQITSIPVPHIIAYSSDNLNELGFEWVLIDNIPGTTLHKVWRGMSWDAKEAIVKQLVEHQAQLFEHRFQKIGNIFRQDDGFVVDRMVTTIFFQGDHLTHNAVRGPFTSSYEWLKARLQLVLTDQQRILSTSCDEDEIEDAEFAHGLAKKLVEILPTVSLPNVSASEPTVLFHDNLLMHNIMVDDEGKLLAIMDWECISAVPLWRACQLPQLFDEWIRREKPEKNNYAPDSDEEDEDDDGLDNEGISDLYWEHLLEYEMWQLRKLFVEEMEKSSPAWIAVTQQGILKVDFERAVQDCDNGWRNRVVKRWVDSLAEGEPKSLTHMLYSYSESN
ncbi:hypothetical protein BU25DRAFT_406137 [Macroventuria anomochaeta]|uniref:Uncharacterized protein n=1 Tax=Macroventuria anomochaeta TaxID=301207 RepID=A0ACB6SEY0_9PLEO|nr:uncharacterized protein BU25DRAFT_406137 [Macroventuria anomochaeta]KAF2632825.1 hypothetical protein BU25DRAFT_406137 [Macroventuria anomochaeta]